MDGCDHPSVWGHFYSWATFLRMALQHTAQLRQNGDFWFSRWVQRSSQFTTNAGHIVERGSVRESMKGLVHVAPDNPASPLSGRLFWDLRDGPFGYLTLRSSRYVAPAPTESIFSFPLRDGSTVGRVHAVFDDLAAEPRSTSFLLAREGRRVVATQLAPPLTEIAFRRTSTPRESGGTFRGDVTSLTSGKREPFSGVILQNENLGVGQLGRGVVGTVTLTPEQ